MSLEKETIQKAVLLIENVIEKSKKHNQTLIIEELEEVLLLLRTASKENSIDPLTYIKVLELLMRFSDWFQN
ncbi:hypothetical protein AAV97_00215 [Acinetobacter sp. Ag2]|jgi:hypothetical protein|uniref:hypothetical protein n=1 Tax=Acinetobacter TaxID=469 RepID=UPI0006292922|nr:MULTISPECIES: hypothetical protein [Acinetobacter]KKW82070.1 hypothetical protein AAV97_00215 [Acinetobacter sp. Ag2]MDM1737531.1 hypothetical protein [Acinetobacter towneri]